MSRKPVIRPNFFIVGAPKSGTTAMNEYLGAHPQIFASYRKEMHFFGSDLTRIPNEFFVLEQKKYLWMFRKAAGYRRVGEASVNYLLSRNAPAEIKAFSPDAKIIIMLRNPVDVLYSYHSQLLWGSFEDIPDLEAAMAAEPERHEGLRIPRTAMLPDALFYRDVVRFAEQVERYFDVFGRDNVHVIIYDDFRDDMVKQYHKTLHFLGVNLMDPPHMRRINTNKVARFRWFQEKLQRQPLIFRAMLKLLPDKFRYWFLGKLSRLNTRLVPREPMPADLRERLTKELEGEVAALGKLLGRDLSHWSRVRG